MRFYEIKTIKPQKPLTPAQARIKSLKQSVDNSKKKLQAERERQRREREAEQHRKAIQRRYTQAF